MSDPECNAALVHVREFIESAQLRTAVVLRDHSGLGHDARKALRDVIVKLESVRAVVSHVHHEVTG